MSISLAREHAAEAGVADRVRFHMSDAAAVPEGDYDLMTMFEAIHDLVHPVAAFRRAKEILKPGASVLIADERVADTFTAPGDLVERLFYGASLLFCLPTGMAESDSAQAGALFRPSMLRDYATEAGFTTVDVTDIDSPTWCFYVLR